MQLILNKGAQIETRLLAGKHDLRLFLRFLWTCLLRASPRRAWFTLSLMVETALRRPRAFRDAVTFALIHKHLYEYMRHTCRQLDQLARQVRQLPEELGVLPKSPAASDAA
jgi:hypothetical protein